MAKVDGCWANVLDDCRGQLTKEHTPSLSVWLAEHEKANRKARKRLRIRIEQKNAPPRWVQANDLYSRHLCEGHNNATTDLDDEAGRLSRALAAFVMTSADRCKNLRVPWTLATYDVDGPKIERWFLKELINTVLPVGLPIGLPIGDPDLPPGAPPRYLVDMVMGHCPVVQPFGLYGGCVVGEEVSAPAEFRFDYMTGTLDDDAPVIAVGLFRFRRFRFAFNLIPVPLDEGAVQTYEGWAGARLVRPFRAFQHRNAHVRVEMRWPAAALGIATEA